MPLTAGTRFGQHEIVSLLGTGGMGEVYRARDLKLGRDVAIKVLPTAFTSHPDRVARLEREARLLASLNHPNVGAIYGVDERDGLLALVLELVDGEPLDAHLRRDGRPGLPIREALGIARQICDALDAAHERGIVHRDLKPANVLIATQGVVKVVDFGLAKTGAVEAESTLDDSQRRNVGLLSHSPTAMPPTVAGVLLGTAPYMSPEQARGRAIDKRTDIWAFGCVLYELLTGRRAFAGDTTSDVIAAILEREPDWMALPADTPPHVKRLIVRCLEKDPKRRLRDIGDARIELEREAEATSAQPSTRTGRVRWIASGVLMALAIAAVVSTFMRIRSTTTVPAWAGDGVVLSIDVPSGSFTPNGMPAMSVDGRYVAWVAAPPDRPGRIWVQALATGGARALDGTDGAAYPFWSPDGRSIGFTAQGQLKQIDMATGAIKSIATLPDVSIGGTWSPENRIVFSARYGLYAIDAAGGTPKLVATLDRGHQENSLRFPRFLPDGRHFLYVARSGRPQQSGAYVGDLDGKPLRLFTTTSSVAYAAPGYLLYAREGALVAQPFDAATLALNGDTAPIAERIGANPGGLAGNFDVSQNGVLVFLKSNPSIQSTLSWIDRSGRTLGTVGPSAVYANFRISPDGARVVVDRVGETGARSVWVYDAGGGSISRVTFTGSDDWQPIWAADGRRVAFMSYRDGPGDIYVKVIGTSQPDEPVVTSEEQIVPGDWSPDGKFFAYSIDRAETRQDIWVVPVDPKGAPIPIARTAANEARPRFSPDGHWVAYDSDESGRLEVYVQPFPPTGAKWQVSTQGGSAAVWRGRELFFVAADNTLVAAPVTTAASSFSAGAPAAIFKLSRFPTGQATFDVAADGQKFLVRIAEDPPRQPVFVTLNWASRLKK